MDAPCLAHAREVVSAEIDQHHVLGAVLLRLEQALGVARPGCGRAGDRVEARPPSLDLDEGLRRGADQGDLAELEQERVRRGVDAAKRAVEVERARRGRPLGPLRDDDLEGVARADVLLRALDRALVLEAAGVTLGRRGRPFAARQLGRRRVERRAQTRRRRRRGPGRGRSRGRSASACRRRRTCSPAGQARRRGAAPSARASRRGRRRGSRRPAPSPTPPRRDRPCARRCRRTSAARGARLRPTRAGTPPRPGRAA